jgi:hypothetical protein
MKGRNLAMMAGILLSACGASGGAANASAEDAPGNEAAPVTTTVSPDSAAAAKEAERAAPTWLLGPDGLEPGIRFGMKQADAVAAATAAFGAPGKPGHSDECGEGPMDFVPFGALQLAFQEGKLVGWSLNEGAPALKTRGGLAVGSPRSALGSVEIDEDSTLGPEFETGGVGGVLDEKGAKVLALWAGDTCQFR